MTNTFIHRLAMTLIVMLTTATAWAFKTETGSMKN